MLTRARRAARLSDERGAMMVLFAITLPVLLVLGTLVISIGNWYTHATQLQTKVDAAAFAGGGVWSFPCAADADARIEAAARLYVGDHTAADGSTVTGSFNPQIGGVDESQMFVSLNQSQWWNGSFPASDFSNPAGSVCEAKTLDVKATEKDTPLLFGVLPFWPDIKRKARVEIQEVDGLTGLLPIAVRFPKPESSAAVLYDEANGNILAVRYFREADDLFGLPTGLRDYTTLGDDMDSWASFPMPGSGRVGVVVATSFRPACDPDADPPITANCFDDGGFTAVNELCRQGNGRVQCFYATGTGSSQTVQSGLHFIRGYDNSANADIDPPMLRSAWLSQGTCTSGNGYFNAVTGSCKPVLSVSIDLGSYTEAGGDDDDDGGGDVETRRAIDTEVRYKLVSADGDELCDYEPECDLRAADGDATGLVTFDSSWSTTHPQVGQGSRGNSFVIRVRLRNTGPAPTLPKACGGDNFSGSCQWFFTSNGRVGESAQDKPAEVLAAPVQRSFMGDVNDQTPISGPIKFLRVASGSPVGPAGSCVLENVDPLGASHPIGAQKCFFVEMGLRGGIAKDQDEPPVVFNLSGTSQSALLDCDASVPHGQIRQEIVQGCRSPMYAPNRFDTTPLCPSDGGPNQFFQTPKAAPFDTWPPYRCVFTRTQASAQQMLQGLIERITGSFPGAPCPTPETGHFVRGRNYWHDANNDYGDATGTDLYTFAQDSPGPRGNRLHPADPRLVRLFMTAYDSFNGSGNEIYPIVAFGSFYITGYGRVTGGGSFSAGWSDPCTGGNADPSAGAGSKPPPDIDLSRPGSYVWGHFIDYVVQSPDATPTGQRCQPAENGMPCVAVLVE